MTLIARPTNREEDWRYADAAFLSTAPIDTFDDWRTVTVAPGDVLRETVQADDAAPSAVARCRVHVGAGGRYEYFATIVSGPYRRIELEVTLEEGAHFEFGGVTLGGDNKVQEFVTRVIHAQPGATSNQVVRAVQWGKSTGNFLGRIEVVRDAQKTDAAQNFRAILLEKGASANTKPELEIFADDVKCAHGAAIGALDQTAAFYMAARGLSPEKARALLVRAFIADAFAAIDDETQRETMLEDALAHLDEGAL
ncbi:SufD family Fe-S cluster assembly protein [Altererythrobacter sp. FM1]|uniref:SufD family Fe-S cluster assembly protein n=1 Tax=Tsuneonella flava TaxID=2055955 RepID=UPI000C7F80DD|nr:SufD family Fe-S cluster assembly protein [Tsuneonella flava]ROT96856.1 SufD family Fe-S cluster assembly protein [Altererythrobacter sp. FM1]